MVRIITPNAGLNLNLWRLAPFWLFRNFKYVVGARAFITKVFLAAEGHRFGGWHIPHKAVIRGLETKLNASRVRLLQTCQVVFPMRADEAR